MDNLTSATGVFVKSGTGRYSLTGVSFSDPVNSITIRPGVINKKSALISASIQRLREKATSLDKRTSATVTLNLQVPSSGFTQDEIDTMVTDLAEVLTPAVLSAILSGAS